MRSWARITPLALSYAAFTLMLLLSFPCFAVPPNVIFILADDLGYGDLGCYGQKKLATPHLDRMAAEGLRFTQAYAGSTVCAPSRSVLMTGLHTGHARIRGNGFVPLASEDLTVAEVLKTQGYRTGLIGKWGLGNEGTPGIPNKQGFDYFFGYLDQTLAHNHYPPSLWRNEEKVTIEGNDEIKRNVCGKCTVYADDLFTDEALQFVSAPGDAPYFLYLSYVIPHANNERFGHDGNGMEVPDLGDYANRDWPPQKKGQAAMVTRLDGMVGRLLDRLRETGADKNTIVFFASDNGALNEGGGEAAFFNSSGPLQGFKRSLHEGGIRVPLIAWSPALVPGGRESDLVCGFSDLLPTLAELSGGKPPGNGDGISIAPTLLGKEGQQQHGHLYWEFHERGFGQAVRMGIWKAIRQDRGPIALYDLATDIHEDKDVAAEQPEILVQITPLFDDRTDSEDFPVRIRKRDK